MKFNFRPFEYVLSSAAQEPVPRFDSSVFDLVAESPERRHRIAHYLRYGTDHKRRRRLVALHVATGAAHCARCKLPINAAEPWHLDHADDGDPKHYLGPSHAACNIRASNY